MPPALRVVETIRSSTATWFAANADGCIGLAIGGVALCEVTPVAIDAQGFVLTWQAALLRPTRTELAGPGSLATVCDQAAKHFRVSPPADDFLARFDGQALFLSNAPAADTEGLLTRFADILTTILDEPLHTLPGAGPEGGAPLALRLAHLRPDVAERADALLEEAGR